MTRQMKLGMFMRPPGHHIAAWRLPETPPNACNDLAHNLELARLAERGLFDMIFWADVVGVWDGDKRDISRLSRVAWIEPFTLLAAFSVVTSRIGLVCTSTTTYNEPYTLARQFASLDVMSGGRAGWNLVTSTMAFEAPNFGRDRHMPKAERYRRAKEFADVVLGLWRSWDDDAFVEDKESGLAFDPDKLHVLDHVGEFFRVRGPLNVPRSPQGHPVMVQAGASDDGRDLAAATAEVIFAAATDIAAARAFYADVKSRVAGHGRDPDHVKIMPGMLVYVGRTAAEAREKFDRLQGLIHPEVGLRTLSNFIEYDISGFPIDGPLPPIPRTATSPTRVEMLVEMARRDNLTIRQLYERIAGGRGHFQLCGSATEIADTLEEWFTTGAADGFNFLPPALPGSLQDFVDLVIPELQRRGLFRTAYEGTTLRANLGLPKPAGSGATRAVAKPLADA